MRLLILALAVLSCLLSTSVAKDSAHDTLIRLAAQNAGVVKLDKHTYDLLMSPKRTWSSSIQFTALDKKRNCNPCREFDPSFRAIAKAWTTVAKADRDQHFFATADFDSSMEVFQKLTIATAPVVLNFGASEGARASAKPDTPVTYDFSSGFDAAPLAVQLSSQTPVPIPYRAPIRWGFFIMTALSATILALAIRYLGPILFSRWTWAAVTVLTSLVMSSGYMFTKIRGMPMTAANGDWIAMGFQNQYGQEVTVVAAMYGILAASFVMLVTIAPRQTSPRKQAIQVYIYSGIIFFLFSAIIAVFRIKNRGYPFRLLL